MPTYEYRCSDCGPFTGRRPMSEAAEPDRCHVCGREAPRVILTAPSFAGMDGVLRTAIGVNEKAAHEPKRSSQEGHHHVHGPNCGCGSKQKSRAVYGADGSKTFPSHRPWMISH